MTGTLAFLSSSDVTVKPKRTRRITQLHERYIESLISEHDGSAQKALLWATQYDKRYVVTRLLANGIPDATSNRFRRCLTFAIRRDDSELLVKFLDTARDKVGLLPTVLGDLPFLKLLVKDADPVVTELYLDCLSVQFRTEIIRAAIEREDFAFLARILPMCKGNDLRESILQDVGFLVLAGKYVACATGVFQLLLQGLNEEDRERMRSRFREGVPASIVAHTLSAGLNVSCAYCLSIPVSDVAICARSLVLIRARARSRTSRRVRTQKEHRGRAFGRIVLTLILRLSKGWKSRQWSRTIGIEMGFWISLKILPVFE